MRPEELSEQLRKGTGEHLEKRRNIVKLSLLALGSMGLVSLYQTGIIQHLPEPPLPFFDADKVDASEEAYAVLQTPDAVLALISYAATAQLASMGGRDRATKQPWIPLMLAAKLAFDALQAGRLSVDQVAKHRTLCFWCLLAAAATFASVPQVLPEAQSALRHLRR